jgi:hypothetical protein
MSAGYGKDTWCLYGVASGRFATGATAVAQAAFRRLTTPRKTLRSVLPNAPELTYGFDLTGYVGAVSAEIAAATIPARVRSELLKDDRIRDVFCTVSNRRRSGEDVLMVTIRAKLSNSGDTFALTLSVSDAATELVGGIQ